MTLSIVVPVYNAAEYLPRCIESLMAQSYTDCEIVLVDDGSTDASGLICDEYAARDARIKVIHKRNGGAAAAWICGVENSRGDVIGAADADDYVEKDYFATLMKMQAEENADIVLGGYSYDINGESRPNPVASAILKAGVYEGSELEAIKDDVFKARGTLYWARWMRVVKREIIMPDLRLTDERLRVGEDVGLALATFWDARKVAFAETTGYHYVQRDTSVMHTVDENEIINFDRLCANIEDISNLKKRGKYIHREFASQMIVVISKILNSGMPRRKKAEMLKQLRASKYAAEVYEKADCGARSFSAKMCLKLFKHKMYTIMTLVK